MNILSKNRAVGYSRVSTDRQGESGLGIEAQENSIKNYCEIKGLDLIKIYRENGISGSIPFAERPEGKKIIGKELEFQALVIAKLDRGFRNTGDCISTIEHWKQEGVSVHVIDLGIDPSTPIGEFFITLMAAFGKLERNFIRDRIKAAIDVKRDRGEKLGGITPFGFDVEEQGGRKFLVRNEEEMEILNLMFDLKHKANYSYYKITKLLNEKGIKSKTGKPWKIQTTIDVISRAGAPGA